MFSVAAEVWNGMARTQELRTRWAQEVFALDQEALEARLEEMMAELRSQGEAHPVPLAYVTLMPLLAEREAIAQYLEVYPDLAEALPVPEGVEEALGMAWQDHRPTPVQMASLGRLLEKDPDSVWMKPEKRPT